MFPAQVYPECAAIETHIEQCKLPADVRADVATIFRQRWDDMHSPLHSVAYMLEPQFQDTDFGTEVSEGQPADHFAVLSAVSICVGACIAHICMHQPCLLMYRSGRISGME